MKTAQMLLVAMSSALLAIGSARAQDDFPNKPIRLIVPTQAGSALDLRMRHFTNAMKRELGWTFVVEPKPGAGQSIGMAMVAHAAPDGYTLVVVNNSITMNPYLQSNPGYDPFKSFVPITQFLWAPLVLVVNANSEIRNVQQLVAMAKAKPGGMNHASSGLGSTPFIAAEVFNNMAGIKTVHVPYKGDAEWLPEIMAGRVDFGFAGPLSSGPLIKAGKIRALGVTSRARLQAMPDVPSIDEAGLPNFEYISFTGFLAPAGTPKPIIDKLSTGFRRVIQVSSVQEEIRAPGGEPVGSLPDEFAAVLRASSKSEGELIKSLGLKPE